MEIHLRRHGPWREPVWSAAAVAGLAAGAVLMVLDLCWPLTLTGGNPWANAHKVAALVLGPQVLLGAGFDLGVVAVALLVHYTLGLISGLVIGILMAGMQIEARRDLALALGVVFGLAVYAVNFYLLTTLFPWFAVLRGWSTLLAHVLFGVSAALVYRQLSLVPRAA